MTDPVLEIDEVSVNLGGTTVLDEVSLSVSAGEFLAVIGPNGAGKSTLLRCLDGIVEPTAGRIALEGRPLRSHSRRAVARIVSYVPQADSRVLPFDVGTFVRMARYPHLGSWAALGPDDHEAVCSALERTETAHLVHRSLQSLSGGERQRVLIAAALAQGGRLLLLDEPTTFLDYRHQVQVVDLLERLHHEEGLTVIAATHDLNRTVAVADNVIALREGSVVFSGTPPELFLRDALAAIYDTEFELIASERHPLPVVIPTRNGR